MPTRRKRMVLVLPKAWSLSARLQSGPSFPLERSVCFHQWRAAVSSSSSALEGIQQADRGTHGAWWQMCQMLRSLQDEDRPRTQHTSRSGLHSLTALSFLGSTPVFSSSPGGGVGMGIDTDTGVFSLSSNTGISMGSPRSSSGSRTASWLDAPVICALKNHNLKALVWCISTYITLLY